MYCDARQQPTVGGAICLQPSYLHFTMTMMFMMTMMMMMMMLMTMMTRHYSVVEELIVFNPAIIIVMMKMNHHCYDENELNVMMTRIFTGVVCVGLGPLKRDKLGN